MQQRYALPILTVLIVASVVPGIARADDDTPAYEPAVAVIGDESETRCDLALALWDDLTADPDPAISPTRKARRQLRQGVALCRAGDDQGADYLFDALTLIGAKDG